MTEGTFEKVHHSDNPLYGPPKLLLCGFSNQAQDQFRTILSMVGLEAVPVIWAHADHARETLRALLTLPDGTGAGMPSTLPRAVIVSGITENQLHGLMTRCRQSGMGPALWATVTPTSEDWALGNLLGELQAEREAFARRGQ